MLPRSDRPLWRPYTQEGLADPPVVLERAEGAYLHDRTGRRFFDGIASWWLITHGHCQPEIVEAIRSQSSWLDQVNFANFSHAPAEELAALLLECVPPELTRVFLSDNGSTAIEAALKMALQACEQRGHPERRRFLAFSSAYHGDTVGAMSVSGASAFNRPYGSVLFDVIRANHPTHSRASAEEYVADFARLIEVHHESLAAVILEPLVQGAGGMVVWPREAVRAVARLCRERDIYLIFDEVMTGFGRTGELFAMDHLGIAPDIVCLSKGLTGGALPLAATLVREEIYQAFLSRDKGRMFFHGHSFTGNPISCAAAVANLRLFQNAELASRRQVIENAHRGAFARMSRKLPLVDARVCGTIGAIELDVPEKSYTSRFSSPFQAEALRRGLFLRPLGNVVYLLPPYCAKAAEVEWAWEVVEAVAETYVRDHSTENSSEPPRQVP